MDHLGRPSTSSSSSFLSAFSLLLLLILLPASARAQGGVFSAQRKFGRNAPVHMVSAQNAARRAQLLSVSVHWGTEASGVDLPIAGHTRMGMYWTDLEIGTPPTKFRVHVDTGSNLLWINGKDCIGCPMVDEEHGIHLPPYDPHSSKTARVHESGEGPCKGFAPGQCNFSYEYGDGKTVEGRYVTDLITYNQVSGDHQVQPARANITFGYATRQANVREGYKIGMLSMGVEGIFGFSGEMSMFSQLASSGKVRKVFAHCLDTVRGGGIFAIGHVVQPKVKGTTPLLQDSKRDLYEARMTSVEVGGMVTDLKTLSVKPNVIFDSGFASGLIPVAVHELLVRKITSNSPKLNAFENEQTGMTCFRSSERLKEFPAIIFHFDTLTLELNADDYAQSEEDSACLVWSTGKNDDGFIFGDMFMSNKLVVYDLEEKVIGWTEHECAKGVDVEGGVHGKVCSVDAHGDYEREKDKYPPATASPGQNGSK